MLTTSKSALASALALTAQIVERRNTIPVLANVLIDHDGTGGRLKGTDMDIEAVRSFEAEASAAFRPFTVPAHTLHDLARKLPDGAAVTIALDADGANAEIRAGRSRFRLQVLPASDFPDLSAGAESWSVTLPAAALARALSGVAFAISTEETRYYLNGVFLHPIKTGLRLVATDGHRLAKRFLPHEAPPVIPGGGVIVPRKTVNILIKALDGRKEEEVTVSGTDAKIRFELDGLVITSKLIDGTFPDYQRVIPTNGTMTAELHADLLKAAVDRVATVSSEKGRACRFEFAEGKLTLNVASPDAGSAEEVLDIEGQAVAVIGFNAKYVLDALTNLPEGPLTIALADSASPAIWRTDGDHAENLIVLMPMRA